MRQRKLFPHHNFIHGKICSGVNECDTTDCPHATPHRCSDSFSCETMVCQKLGKEVTCVWMPHPDWKEVIVACNRTGVLCKQENCPHFFPHHFNPHYCELHDECKIGLETRWRRGLDPCGCNVAAALHLYNIGKCKKNDVDPCDGDLGGMP